MSNTIYNLDTANLFVGDDDPENSQFLVLNSLTLPALEESTRSHSGGGAAATIDIGMRKINALTFPFQLTGLTPDVTAKFMPSRRTKYTIRGNISDVRSQKDIPLLAVVEGRMIKATTSEFRKDGEVSSDYEIREVVFYSLKIDSDEKFYFDYFAGPNGVRVNGVSIFSDVARNIGLGV